MNNSWIDSLLESLLVRHYSGATIKSYRSSLDQFGWFLRSKGIKEIQFVTREIIKAYALHLVNQGYAVNTQSVRLKSVYSLFSYLREIRLIEANPCLGLHTPYAKDRLPKRILTTKEAVLLLSVPNKRSKMGKRDSAILELFYSTGIRLAEMTSLTVDDIDLRNGILRINKGKGGKDRILPIGRTALKAINLYIQKVWLYWATHQYQNRLLWLSIRYPHDPLKYAQIEALVKRYAKKAGLSHVTPHVWRHSCASHLAGNGINIEFVRQLLGHKSLKTTQIYLRTSIPELKADHAKHHRRTEG